MRYQLIISRRQQEALRTAISFWERKEIKVKVAEFIETLKEIEISEVQIKCREFTKTVVDEWMNDMLSKVLNDDMIHTVRMIGETIINWYQHINHEYKMEEKAINCIENIKWTPYSTVDAVKVFESSLLNNPNVDTTEVYNFACHYAIEDHIDNLWDKIPQNMQNDCYKDIYKRFDQHILAYWKHRRESDLPNLMRSFQAAANYSSLKDMEVFNLIYDESRSTEENMLRLSVSQGYSNATKFFWEQLTEVERNDSVVKCASITVLSYLNKGTMTTTRDYQRSKYAEIWVFMMNQMSESHKKAFFNEELTLHYSNSELVILDDFYQCHNSLEMLLSTWPWQKLLIPALKDMIQHQDGDSRIPYSVLRAITYQMRYDHKLAYFLETSKYRRLFRDAWLIIPASIKQKIVPHYGRDVIDNLIEVLDLESLELLFNDPEITGVRDKLIDSGLYTFMNLIMQRNFDILNEILDIICKSAEDTELFIQKVVHFYVCHHLHIVHDYGLGQQLLDWSSNIDEENKKCKDHYKSMVIREIWSVYHKDISSVKDKCSGFLHWRLEPEEEIALFKKGIIVKLVSGQSSANDLDQLRRRGIRHDFIVWCLFTDEEWDLYQRVNQLLAQANNE